MYFNNKFIQHTYTSHKLKRNSLNKIFVSKAEIKHTNSKAIITVYVYNREKIIFLNHLNRFTKGLSFLLKQNKLIHSIFFKKKFWSILINYATVSAKNDLREMERKYTFFSNLRHSKNLSYRLRFILDLKCLSLALYRWLVTLRKHKLRINLNKYKFEDKFLFKLNNYIVKYYDKPVEFNIVNLKSVQHNADIFTEILATKIKDIESSPIQAMNESLDTVELPAGNNILERGKVQTPLRYDVFENSYKNNSLNLLLNKNLAEDNLNHLLYNIYNKENISSEIKNNNSKDFLNYRNIILNNIKYKNIAGVRLIVKGRLTRRYRADRATHKLKWKGGLKNIDSAFKGMSTALLRGHLNSNIEKSISVSKRRIGSFAVKGWFSGK